MTDLRRIILTELMNRMDDLKQSVVLPASELDQTIQRRTLEGNCNSLKGRIPYIAYQNLCVTMSIWKTVAVPLEKQCTFIVHGSTGKGEGKVAANLDYDIHRTEHGVQIECRVIRGCRDDIDAIAVCKDTLQASRLLENACEKAAIRYAVPITCNVVSDDTVCEELKNRRGSPALRRIFIFNRPKCLAGYNEFEVFMQMAQQCRVNQDLKNELDFRLLMQVSGILDKHKVTNFTFVEDEVLKFFPTIHETTVNEIHTGFPKSRNKIVCTEKGRRKIK